MKVKFNALFLFLAMSMLPGVMWAQNLSPYGYIPNGAKRSKVPPATIVTAGGVGYQFSKDTAPNYEVYDSVTQTWTTASSGIGATTKLTIIQAPDTMVANSNSNLTCNSVRVDTGAFLASRATSQGAGSGIRIGGGIGTGTPMFGMPNVYDSAILVNNGSIGAPATIWSTPVTVNNYWYVGMMRDTVYYKLTGSGYYNLTRIYIGASAAKRIRLLMDADIDLSLKGIALTNFVNSAANNSAADSIAYTISEGKTVRITDSSYWHMSSTSTTVRGGLYIYNINGTLDLSSSNVKSALVPADSNVSSLLAVNINGTLNLPKGGLVVGAASSINSDSLKGKVALSVFANGTVNGLVDSSLAMRNYSLFRMMDSSARFRKVCAAVDTLFPIGYGANDTVNNSVSIKNTGTVDTIAVSVSNSFADLWPAASLTHLVQKQWRLIESTVGGSNLEVKVSFVNADKGSAFVGTTISGYVYTGQRWKVYPATITGAGTQASPYVASIVGVDSFRRVVIGDAGLAVPAPVITAVSTMTQFVSNVNVTSAAQSFTVMGTTLSGNITVTPPAKFTISLDTVSANFTSNALTLTPVAGIVGVTPIYVKFMSTTSGTYNDSIRLTSPMADTVYVKVSGLANPVSVKDVNSNRTVTVYPNPVMNGSFMVKMGELSAGTYTVSLYNLMGQKVMSKNIQHNGKNEDYKVEMPSLPAGNYELNIIGNSVNMNAKISVQ